MTIIESLEIALTIMDILKDAIPEKRRFWSGLFRSRGSKDKPNKLVRA